MPASCAEHRGTFVEVNVRTDIADPPVRRSVWFFSLDVPRSLIVALAPFVFALPSCWSRTEYEADAARRRSAIERRPPRRIDASAVIEFTIGDRINGVTGLDTSLSVRLLR